jgi:hypothetical protein
MVMTTIAMENPNHKWRFLAGKILYKWAIYTMAMLNNQRVNDKTMFTYVQLSSPIFKWQFLEQFSDKPKYPILLV